MWIKLNCNGTTKSVSFTEYEAACVKRMLGGDNVVFVHGSAGQLFSVWATDERYVWSGAICKIYDKVNKAFKDNAENPAEVIFS